MTAFTQLDKTTLFFSAAQAQLAYPFDVLARRQQTSNISAMQAVRGMTARGFFKGLALQNLKVGLRNSVTRPLIAHFFPDEGDPSWVYIAKLVLSLTALDFSLLRWMEGLRIRAITEDLVPQPKVRTLAGHGAFAGRLLLSNTLFFSYLHLRRPVVPNDLHLAAEVTAVQVLLGNPVDVSVTLALSGKGWSLSKVRSRLWRGAPVQLPGLLAANLVAVYLIGQWEDSAREFAIDPRRGSANQ